ncbi:MAG: von Willebrand factor type A domain-containing protein, partial [Planctomycetota bacterium]
MTIHEDDPRLTAYALGEIEGEERDEFARALEADPQAKAEVRARRALAERLRAKPADPQAEGLDPLRRERVLAAAGRRPRRTRWLLVAAPALAAAALLLALFVLPRTSPPANVEDAGGTAIASSLEDPPSARARPGTPGFLERQASKPPAPPGATVVVDEERGLHLRVPGLPAAPGMDGSAVGDRVQSDLDAGGAESGPQVRLADAPLSGPASNGLIGLGSGAGARFGGRRGVRAKFRIRFGDAEPETTPPTPPHGTEAYGEIRDNRFYRVEEKDTSTFSIDVDTASYANVRRFLDREGRLPPPDAVRIEELVNYFPYDYAPPPADSEHPFAAHTAVAVCPWDPSHRLVRIALEGKVMAQEERPAASL